MSSTSFASDATQWRKWPNQADLLGEVDLEDPASVETAIGSILNRLSRQAYDAVLLESAMQDVLKTYRGDCPGLLRCNMLLHDLRHAQDMGMSARDQDDAATADPNPTRENPLVGHHALLCTLLAVVHGIVSSQRDMEPYSCEPD